MDLKKAYMYGFRKSSPDETGWLKVKDRGYSVVQDRKDATGFETENFSKRKVWGGPAQWCRFFNSEDELADWKFHIVVFTEKGKILK